MTSLAILADEIFDGTARHRSGAVLLADGRIAGVTSAEEGRNAAEVIELPAGALLVPGFIDVQVNGGGGVLFNDEPTVAGVRAIAAAHRRFGTTGMLPTLISGGRDAIRRAIDAVGEAMEKEVPGVLGIHLEGPFINPSRRGAHPADGIVSIAESDVELLTSLGERGRTVVTLAPECVPPELVAELARRGAIVSAGHTDAKAEQVKRALDAGLTGVTHLFNAMSQLGSREPGAVGAALADGRPFVSVIADGHHLADLSLRLAVKAIGPEHLMLITDAMPPVGTELTEFTLFGNTIYVRDGRLIQADGTLAGAHLHMSSAVRHMTGRVGVRLEDALTMASGTPARYLRMETERGRIARGLRADLVALDGNRNVLATWIDGQCQRT
jgi:N-acetylglucosamine-6-phosphate deacetylase